MKKVLVLILTLTILTGCSMVKEEKSPQSRAKKEQVEETLLRDEVPVETSEELVTYINDVEQEVTTLTNKNTLTKEEENKLKNTFITLTDFIFYGGTIKGKTFSELEVEAKDKILSLWSSIDQKIETKIPNYKEKISTTSKNTYENIKEQAKKVKESIKEKYKEEVGVDDYNQTIDAYEEGKNNLKEAYEPYKPAVSKAKEKTKEVVESAKEKATTWYNNLKEESR